MWDAARHSSCCRCLALTCRQPKLYAACASSSVLNGSRCVRLLRSAICTTAHNGTKLASQGRGGLGTKTKPCCARHAPLACRGRTVRIASWHSAATTAAHLQHHAWLQAALDMDVKLRFGQLPDEGFCHGNMHAVEDRHGKKWSEDEITTAVADR